MLASVTGPADPVTLGALVAAINGELAAAGQQRPLPPLSPLRVFVVGPSDAGKTTLVKKLLGAASGTLPGLLNGPLPTGAPVEFSEGSTTVIIQDFLDSVGRSRSHTVPGAARDVFAATGLRQLRIQLNAPVLREWGIELVDTPGLDGPMGNGVLSLATKAGRVGVLYVIPSRGLTERDLYALERLRELPVIVIENVRDGDVSADRSAFTRLAVDRSASGWSVSVVLSRLAKPGPEREVLRLAVTLMHTELRAAERQVLLESALSRIQELRAGYAARLRALTDPRTIADPMLTMRAVADVLAMEREGPGLARADRSMDALVASLRTVPSAAALRSLLAEASQTAADRYTVEAVSRSRSARQQAAGQGPADTLAAKTIGELREALRGYLELLQGDKKLRFTASDRKALHDIDIEVGKDRFELVFVGQFSSGKSTLINALLGTDLLPARRRPTTATINELCYADNSSAEPQWIDPPVEVTLLHATAPAQDAALGTADRSQVPGQHRVHIDEITALERWLRAGTVRPESVDWRVDPGQAHLPSRSINSAAAFQELFSTLSTHRDADGNLPPYAYTTHYTPQISAPFPIGVTIGRWAAPPPPIPGGRTAPVGEALDWIGADPAVALRVDRVRIGYRHQLLRYLTVVDTPGTDAPIPRHRVATESAIKGNKQRAVVYCFNGAKPAAAEDTRNLDLLKAFQVGSSELSRFFFVITQRGLLVKRDKPGDPAKPDLEAQAVVHDRVRDQLRKLGITPERIYFTEVVSDKHDKEFEDLANALNQFGVRSKGPQLRGWVEGMAKVVRDVTARDEQFIAQLGADARQREQIVAGLRREVAAVRAAASELASDPTGGVPWARGRAAPGGLSAAGDFGRDIGALLERDDFAPFARRADEELASLNRQARERVESAWSAVVARARGRLSAVPGRDHEITLPAVSLPGEIFPSAELLQAIRSCYWRSGWERVKGVFGHTRWKADVEDNRARISRAWEASARTAASTVDASITAAATAAGAELNRICDGIEAQIRSLSQPPSPADRDAAQASLAAGRKWLDQLGSLSRRIEVHERGIG